MDQIVVPLPDPNEEVDLKDYFWDFISDDVGDFRGPLTGALDLDVGDHRSTIDEIEVEDVVLHDDGDVTLHYRVDHSAYYGCADMTSDGQEYRAVTGRRSGETWVFDRYASPEKLAPNEEL